MRKDNRIGETNNNYQGLQMTIVAYRSRRDIDVKFSDGYIAHNVRYKSDTPEVHNYCSICGFKMDYTENYHDDRQISIFDDEQ